jgi:hypothetical protein
VIDYYDPAAGVKAVSDTGVGSGSAGLLNDRADVCLASGME